MRTRFVRGATLKQAEQDATAFTGGEQSKKPKKKAGVQIRYVYLTDGCACACGGHIGTIGYSIEPGKTICFACAMPYRTEDDKTKKNNLYKHFEDLI